MPFDLGALPANVRPTVKRLQEAITFSDNITKGANGFVLIGHNRLLDRKQVVKIYYWGGGLHVEPALLASLESPHVLTVDSAEAIDQDDAFFITRYCAGGDLDDQLALRSFGPREAIDALLQISAGVSYLHGKGYLHRDIKPSNLFCNDAGGWVIGDFGSVVKMNEHGFASTQSKHSIIYRPPEDFEANVKYYRQGDIYQLGMVLYQLLGGRLNYDVDCWLTAAQITHREKLDDIEAQVFAQSCIQSLIQKGKLLNLDTLPPVVPEHLKRLLRSACRVDYRRRPQTVADLISSLNNLRRRTFNWRWVDHRYQLETKQRSFRLVESGEAFQVEKRVGGGWKTQHGLLFADALEAVFKIEELAS